MAARHQESDSTAANKTLTEDLLSSSVLIDKSAGLPCEYMLQMDETYLNKKTQVRRMELGIEGVSGINEKVIMIVGETGCGKTTLINFIANYILGVEFNDDFRFRLEADSDEKDTRKSGTMTNSQTKWVTAYTFHHRNGFQQPFTLTIIDTPGFGDTGGVQNDKKIVDKVREFFSSDRGVKHLDAVGFVVQAGVNRLTASHRFVFDSILTLFGNDIGSNICMMITFVDANTPPVLKTLEEAKIEYSLAVRFNNSAAFAKFDSEESDEDDPEDRLHANKMLWRKSVRSFETFFGHLGTLSPQSLTLTKEVLRERRHLQTCLTSINKEIESGLNKLDQLEDTVELIKTHQNDLDKNRNFTYRMREVKCVLKETPVGTYTTNCLKCNRTCHYPCSIADDKKKAECSAMKNGFCKICEHGCAWSEHKNMPYQIVTEIGTSVKTAQDLKSRYSDAQGKLKSAKDMAQRVYLEYLGTKANVMNLVTECKKCLQRLQEIALKPDPLNEVDYIDQLIEAERLNRTDAFKERIRQLNDIRSLAVQAERLKKDGVMKVLIDDEKRICSKYPNLVSKPTPDSVADLMASIN